MNKQRDCCKSFSFFCSLFYPFSCTPIPISISTTSLRWNFAEIICSHNLPGVRPTTITTTMCVLATVSLHCTGNCGRWGDGVNIKIEIELFGRQSKVNCIFGGIGKQCDVRQLTDEDDANGKWHRRRADDDNNDQRQMTTIDEYVNIDETEISWFKASAQFSTSGVQATAMEVYFWSQSQ